MTKSSETAIVVKREPGERKVGFARSPKEHYVYQVALIDKVVKPPWARCFGNLGTGFIGVHPERPEQGATASFSSTAKSRPPPRAEGGQKGQSGDEAEAAEDDEEAQNIHVLPPDATIIIFVQAPSAALHNRCGKVLGGYPDLLDINEKTLDWSAQRSDRNNKKIQSIIAHKKNGGRVVVAVRAATIRDFTLLGEVSLIDNLQRSLFLVNDGDHIIQEKGTMTFHREITANCLNLGLRSGIGLTAARYPLAGKARWCLACCYHPPRAVLHFSLLHDDGVAAFQSPGAWVLKRERLNAKKELADAAAVPVKRLRCKQSLIKDEPGAAVKVKAEQQETQPPRQEFPKPSAVKREVVEELVELVVSKPPAVKRKVVELVEVD